MAAMAASLFDRGTEKVLFSPQNGTGRRDWRLASEPEAAASSVVVTAAVMPTFSQL